MTERPSTAGSQSGNEVRPMDQTAERQASIAYLQKLRRADADFQESGNAEARDQAYIDAAVEYVRVTGGPELAQQVIDLLEKNNENSVALRQSLAEAGQTIWQTAKTRGLDILLGDVERQSGRFDENERAVNSEALELFQQAFDSAMGGASILATIGGFMQALRSFAPGIADIGDRLVNTVAGMGNDFSGRVQGFEARITGTPELEQRVDGVDIDVSGEAADQATSIVGSVLSPGAVRAEAQRAIGEIPTMERRAPGAGRSLAGEDEGGVASPAAAGADQFGRAASASPEAEAEAPARGPAVERARGADQFAPAPVGME